MDQKLRLRNFDARNEKIETGAVVTSRRGSSIIERGKGICYQWKEKGQCSQGDRCSFRHEKCVEEKVSEAKVTIVPLFDNYADISKVFARDRLVNIGIVPSVNFTKQRRGAKPEIHVCSRITRLMNNQTKSQKKLLFTKKKRKRRQKCCGCCENCTTIGLRVARLGTIGFSKRKTVSGKPDAKSLGINSKSTVHSVYAASSKNSGKERTIAWNNASQTSSRHGTLPETYTSSKKKKRLHSTRPRKNGYCRLPQQKSRKKESMWWIPELVCIRSASEILTLPNWRP